VLRRWAIAIVGLLAVSRCTLVTDFDGIADGDPDAASGGSTGKGPTFPRLALYEVSNPKDFHLYPHQQEAAKVHLNVMGIYPGWEESHAPIEEVVQTVKSLNPETKLFTLFAADHFRNVSTGDAYQEVIDKLNTENWWLYESGTSGALLVSDGTDFYYPNPTLFTPRDTCNKTFVEWYAGWAFKTWMAKSPTLDGIYFDRLDWMPEVDADFNRDGRPTSPPARTRHLVSPGMRQFFIEYSQLAPGRLLLEFGWLDDTSAVCPNTRASCTEDPQ
jgi:hypothetical protein